MRAAKGFIQNTEDKGDLDDSIKAPKILYARRHVVKLKGDDDQHLTISISNQGTDHKSDVNGIEKSNNAKNCITSRGGDDLSIYHSMIIDSHNSIDNSIK